MILALYDVTGIQNFIFSTNKTKENIGASLIVQEVFEEYLINALVEKVTKSKIKTDWEKSDNLAINDDETIDAEVIYIGGGNSLVLFRDREIAVETTKALSVKLLESTKGSLGVMVGYQETNLENFSQDLADLHSKLAKKKDEFVQTSPLKGIAITYEAGDGLSSSAEKLSDKDSDLARTKISSVEKDYFNKLIEEHEGYSFPQEFDHLKQVEGDSFIGVVRLDGNSMGDFIDKRISKLEDYQEAVSKMRKLSQEIRDTYLDVFKEVTNTLVSKQSEIETSRKVQYRKDAKKDITYLPIRPLIIAGDDVTFVCNGMLAIQIVDLFLTKLSEKKIEDEAISACAGVTIIKSHYPFSRGYNLAEALCSSAKQKAKAINEDKPGSWFDYHIIYAGFNDDLDTIRKENYNVNSMKPIENADYPQYNLLIRPFRVTGSDSDINDWSNYTTALKELVTSKNKMPRSRLKGLRSNFQLSEEAVNEYHEINKSRDYNLPIFPNFEYNNDKLFKNNQTP